MTNKKGLGKGLGALLSDYNDIDIEEQLSKTIGNTNEVREISISQIDRNTNQPRKSFDEKALAELAESIKVHGVIQPIILSPRGGRFLLVAGERRWRSAKMAGLKTIPAIVKEYSDRDIAEISIIENLQREDLSPVESAKAIKRLVDEFKMTQEEVADKIGKSRPAVSNTLRLLLLENEILTMIDEGRLSAGHARTLIPIESKEIRLELAKLACDNKITVRELERYIKEYQNPKPEKSKQSQSIEIRDFTKKLQLLFATKVSIQGGDNKGKISINYYSKDDLERIHSILNKF